jgi:hypothetical protein
MPGTLCGLLDFPPDWPHGRPIDAKATPVEVNESGTSASDWVQLREIS